MRKILSLSLCFLLVFPSSVIGSESSLSQRECDQFISERLGEIHSELSWFQSLSVKAFTIRLKDRLKKQCKNGCTKQQLALLIQSSIESSFQKVSRIRGTSILVGIMVVSAFVTYRANEHLPENWRWLATILAQAAVLGVYVLGAPLWEPIQSRFRHTGFRIGSGDSSRTSSALGFEQIWWKMQSTLSINSQMARNTQAQILLFLQNQFREIREAIESKETERAAASLSFVVRYFHELYPDFDPKASFFVEFIQTQFVGVRLNRNELKKKTLSYLEETQVGISDSVGETLDVWLGISSVAVIGR